MSRSIEKQILGLKNPVDEEKLSKDIRMLFVLKAMHDKFVNLIKQIIATSEDFIEKSSYQELNDIVKKYIYDASKKPNISLENLGIKEKSNFNLIDLQRDRTENIIDKFDLSYNHFRFYYLSFSDLENKCKYFDLKSKASVAIDHIYDVRERIDKINEILDGTDARLLHSDSYHKMSELSSLYSYEVGPLDKISELREIFEINNSKVVTEIKEKYEREKINFQNDLLKEFGDFGKKTNLRYNIDNTLKCVLGEDVGKLFGTLCNLREKFYWLEVDPIDGPPKVLEHLYTEINKYIESIPKDAFSSEDGAEIKKIIDGLPKIIEAAKNDLGKARIVFKFVFDLFCFLIPFVSLFTRENHFVNLWHPVSRAKLERFKQDYKKLLKDIDINKLNIKGQNQKPDLR